MNSPALHSFSWPKLGNRTPVSIVRDKELESRLKEMDIWRERCLFLERDKRILQWMNFDIADYADIIFAVQTGDMSIEYNEQSFNNVGKSIFIAQREASLKEMKNFIKALEDAKTYWHNNFETIFRLLNRTINDMGMIKISPLDTVTEEVRQSTHNYEILQQQCKELFDAANILINTHKNFSVISLSTITNLYNIRLFKSANPAQVALKNFYQAKEVSLLLEEQPDQPRKSFIDQYVNTLEQLREKAWNPKGMDGLQRQTNSLICQVLGSRYMETIVEQTKAAEELLRKYERKCWRQIDILRKLDRAAGSINFSWDLLQVFVSMETVTKQYRDNIGNLSERYDVVKGFSDMIDVIRKLELIYIRIQDRLTRDVGTNYRKNQNFDLNPIVSVEEAICQTHKNMGIFQTIHYLFMKILHKQDVFDDVLMKEVLASPQKMVSIDWKAYKVLSFHKPLKKSLSEYEKHPLYGKMTKTLEDAIIIYVKKVEDHVKTFSDSSWGSGKEKETIETLLGDIKKRIAKIKV